MENIQQSTHMITLTILNAEKCSYHSVAGLQIDVKDKYTAQHPLEIEILAERCNQKYCDHNVLCKYEKKAY